MFCGFCSLLPLSFIASAEVDAPCSTLHAIVIRATRVIRAKEHVCFSITPFTNSHTLFPLSLLLAALKQPLRLG